MRVINLPAIHKSVTLAAYVAGVRLAIQHPDAEFKHGLTCWWACSGRDIRRQFLAGVHDRINQAIPYSRRGIANAL